MRWWRRPAGWTRNKWWGAVTALTVGERAGGALTGSANLGLERPGGGPGFSNSDPRWRRWARGAPGGCARARLGSPAPDPRSRRLAQVAAPGPSPSWFFAFGGMPALLARLPFYRGESAGCPRRGGWTGHGAALGLRRAVAGGARSTRVPLLRPGPGLLLRARRAGGLEVGRRSPCSKNTAQHRPRPRASRRQQNELLGRTARWPGSTTARAGPKAERAAGRRAPAPRLPRAGLALRGSGPADGLERGQPRRARRPRGPGRLPSTRIGYTKPPTRGAGRPS